MSARRDATEALLDAEQRALTWELPRKLVADPLPEWPDVLPEPAARFAAEHARTKRVPVAMMHGWVYGALSAAAGGRLVVQPWAGWDEPAHLYVAVVAPPGAMKSPTCTAAMRPIFDLERRLLEERGGDIEAARARREIAEKRLAVLKRQASETDGADRLALEEDAVELQRELAVAAPAHPQLVVGDVTPERLAGILSEQGERVAMISGETALFGHANGRYGDDPAIEVLLSAHARERVSVDRQGRPPLVLREPALSVAVGVQPAVIAKARERDGRGLLARFLFVAPDHDIGHRDTSEPEPIDPEVTDAYAELVRGVAASLYDRPEPSTLRLDTDARATFAHFRGLLERERGEGGQLDGIEGWGAKADGLLLRIAGLMHVAHGHAVTDDVTEHTIARAYLVVRVAIAHARRCLLDPPDEPRVFRIARKIQSWATDATADEPRERFTFRDAHHACRKLAVGEGAAREVSAALDLLARHNAVRELGPVPGQHAKTRVFALNPALLGDRHRPMPAAPVAWGSA